MTDSTSIDPAEEIVKIRDVLGAFWSRIPHASETDANDLAAQIDAIGPQPVPETTEPTAEELQAELDRRNAEPSKPLSEMSAEELQAELDKRAAAQGQ
jgi:hypothetical protein